MKNCNKYLCSHSSGHGGEADVANVTVVHGITGIRISQKVKQLCYACNICLCSYMCE